MEVHLGHVFSSILAGLLVSLIAKQIIGKSLDQLDKITSKVIDIDKKLVGIDIRIGDIAEIKIQSALHEKKLIELESKLRRLNGGSHLHTETISR